MSSTMDTQRDVKKMGYLKKQKTMKKKLFVLREESLNAPCRLEYYDNEKKFVCSNPKRSIHLHNCFSINAKSDSKHKYVIVLFTKEDCFGIICDNADDQKDWLTAMVELRNYHSHGVSASPMYEHIWPVTVKSKGLGSGKHLTPGQYRLCLTPKELSFVRPSSDSPDLVFQLASIRKCGHTECFFYLEPGRMAVTGSGVLWMQVEDIVIAQNMHEAILSFMTASNMSGDQPVLRPRRHTVTDKAKPSNMAVKQRGGSTSHSTATLPVTRSKTMSAADHPNRQRMSQSPSRIYREAASNLRPLTTIDLGSLVQGLSPPSSSAGNRSRTNSIDSSVSRNASTIYTDLTEGSMEELTAGSVTPTVSLDSYMPMEHQTRGVSPLVSPTALEPSLADYMEVDHGARPSQTTQPTQSDDYLEMDVSRSREAPRFRDGSTVARSKSSSKDKLVRRSSESRSSESRSEDHSNYMAMGSSREDNTILSDDGSIDSGIRSECGRLSNVEPRSGSRTSSRGRPDVDDYIPMNLGATALDENAYMDMSQNSSVAASPAPSSTSSLHEILEDANYTHMTGSGTNSLHEQEQYYEASKELPSYTTMSRLSSSPRPTQGLRPDRVISYLAHENTDQIPLRSSSVGSRPQVTQNKTLNDFYMDMRGTRESTGADGLTSSAPILSRGANTRGRGARGGTHSQSQRSLERKKSSKETLEEKDFLMEMDFNTRRLHGKDHEYEEIRPRSSSGGSHDFRYRTSSSGSQERRRTSSFGYREKLSKLASLARASVQEYRKSENGHRQRMATVGQESFHKRTSSFGMSASDMRPRSSSHGNSRYVDMTAKLHKSSSQTSSHDSLHQTGKRGSLESVTSTASDYLDMQPRVSTSPSQALVAMFKSMDKSRHSPRSPLLIDSDYLSMEPSKSSGESSTEFTSTDLQSQKSTGVRSARGKSRGKRGSTSSRVSHSSSESLTSNTSQSSEGRGPDRSRGILSSTITEDGGGSRCKRSAQSVEKELKVKSVSLDDSSYVLYSPGNSRDPSPQPGTSAATLEKVASPIRADDHDSPALLGLVASTLTKDKHEYVNIKYAVRDLRPPQPDVQLREPQQTSDSGVRVRPGAGQSHDVGRSPSLDVPSTPCPQAPVHANTNITHTHTNVTHPTELPTRSPELYVSVDTSDEPDYLVISPVSATSETTFKLPSPPRLVEEPLRHVQEPPRLVQEPPRLMQEPPRLVQEPPRLMQEPTRLVQELPRLVQEPPRLVQEPPRLVQEPPEEDYIMIGGAAPPVEVISSSSAVMSTESDYLDCDPGVDAGGRGGAKPRPKLPTMPVPLPKLDPVVSPIRDTVSGEVATDVKVTPLPSSEIDEYIEIGPPDVSLQIVFKQPDSTPSAIGSVAMATTDANPESLNIPDVLQQQRPLDSESLQLSASKTSLSSAGGSEVNYATLDLQAAGDEGGDGTRRPKHASGGSSASSDSPDDTPLQYAQIDFKKSEQLRKSANSKKTRAPFDI